MKYITKRERGYWEWGGVAHTIAVLGLVALTAMGMPLESLGGWSACPPQLVRVEGERWKRRGAREGAYEFSWRVGWVYLQRSWMMTAVRSEALLMLVWWTESWEWEWLCLLTWMGWLWRGLGAAWPGLGRQPGYRAMGGLWERASQLALLELLVVWVGQQVPMMQESGPLVSLGTGQVVGVGSVLGSPRVEVEEDEAAWYHIRLRGEFELHIDGSVESYKRMAIIFLQLLEVAEERRKSRRTRDGRTPFVRQQQLEEWFGVPQPHISLRLSYWLNQDWRRLLSQKSGAVLTLELQQRIIDTWARFPWRDASWIWKYLKEQGETITLEQVRQAGQESGWTRLRKALRQVYVIRVESFRPRDEWLVSQLLAQVQELVERLESLGGLTPEENVTLTDLKALGQELNLGPAVARRPLPWVYHLERLLFGHWELVDDGSVHCTYCGTTEVARKSRKPRLKQYVDEQGELRAVEVYRYYCHNPHCPYKTFTHLPANLLPYSRWTLNHHLSALQIYEWMRSVYRCTGQTLCVSKMTAYRWVSGFGYQLLPVAAMFGVVRSSGVVGVDEKYVLVPKNDKPEGDMKRWMYVYFAVDCYTYDLLHIEIYPYNTKQSAHAFLLALRAKGYQPRVIVTDMRVDYRGVVAQVFSKAVHHECIFHALQQVREHAREVYGTNYTKTNPEVEQLLREIDRVFDARTKRTARRRYEKVLAQRETFVAHTPDATAIFDFLERHWPYLVNTIESHIIPSTNNATEQVIRIFTQHYKTFCGFENIDSARLYLAVFEKVYRFTPFSSDAQKRIRGKCPLELAGYEVHKLPMAQLFRGLALQWPASAFREVSPT